jgi:hypothetical protein
VDVADVPGSSTGTPSPVRNAFGAHVIDSTAMLRYGCAPLVYRQARGPMFVAAEVTRSPASLREYSMRSSRENG